MKLVLILLLRVIFTTFFVQFVYNVISGNVIRPFYPYNLILGLFLVMSGLSIWFRSTIARALGIFSGVIWPLMVLFQMGMLYFSMPTGRWRSDFLWFKLEDNIALLYSFGLPTIVFLLSVLACLSLLIDQSTAENGTTDSSDTLNHRVEKDEQESLKWLLLIPFSFLLMISSISVSHLIRNWDSNTLNPKSGKRGIVRTELKESDSDYYALSVGQDDYNHNEIIHFDCVGASIENVISSLQDLDIIKAKWVINRHLLPEGFYDINLDDQQIRKRKDVPQAFYLWVNSHFTINLEEKIVRQKVRYCEVSTDQNLIRISTKSELNSFTESIDGRFGMQFEGVSMEEFCDWLTENTGELFVSKSKTNARYDFFLPCFPLPQSKKTIYEGLKMLQFNLSKGHSEVLSIVVTPKANKALEEISSNSASRNSSA